MIVQGPPRHDLREETGTPKLWVRVRLCFSKIWINRSERTGKVIESAVSSCWTYEFRDI